MEFRTEHSSLKDAVGSAAEGKQVTASPRLYIDPTTSQVQTSLLTEDLATFLITHHVMHAAGATVSEIKDYFSFSPELSELVEPLLAKMEQSGLIQVQGGKVVRLAGILWTGSTDASAENLMRFIPNLMKLTSKRVLQDAAQGQVKPKQEALYYFVLPEDPQVATKARKLVQDFKLNMAKLVDESQAVRSDRTRVVTVVDCLLEPEDFV